MPTLYAFMIHGACNTTYTLTAPLLLPTPNSTQYNV